MIGQTISHHSNRNTDFNALFGKRNILWCNISGAYVIGLDGSCPIRAVACLNDGQDFDLIEARSGVQFLSYERSTRRRVSVHGPDVDRIVLLLADRMAATIRHAPRSSWLLMCPQPTKTLDDFAASAGCAVATNPAELCHWLNDKRNFLAGRKQLGLPDVAGRWRLFSSLRYGELALELGTPFVLQALRGHTGTGTAIVGDESEFQDAAERLGDADVWCARYLGRLSLNINAFTTETGVAVSYPSVQLEGLGILGARRGVYCGNDFSAAATLAGGIIEEAQSQTERLGSWLRSLGYCGLFGVDFVLDESTGRLVAVDLNPRWQGSTTLEAMASVRDGRIPLPLAQLAYSAGALGSCDVASMADVFRRPLLGSQMILETNGGHAERIEHTVRAGVYRTQDGVQFDREAVDLGELRTEDELLLGSAVVRAGTTIEPGSRPARVFGLRPVVDARTYAPEAWAQPAAEAFLRLFRLPVQIESRYCSPSTGAGTTLS